MEGPAAESGPRYKSLTWLRSPRADSLADLGVRDRPALPEVLQAFGNPLDDVLVPEDFKGLPIDSYSSADIRTVRCTTHRWEGDPYRRSGSMWWRNRNRGMPVPHAKAFVPPFYPQ